jgi:transposase
MAIPVALRGDFKASQLRGLARKTKDGPQARRLLAVAAIYDGATRTEAAKIGGVGLQIIRDWVMRFNARGAAGLLDGKSPGQPSKLNDVQRQAIVRMIESGPIPAIHGVVRWRLIDLSQWIRAILRRLAVWFLLKLSMRHSWNSRVILQAGKGCWGIRTSRFNGHGPARAVEQVRECNPTPGWSASVYPGRCSPSPTTS